MTDGRGRSGGAEKEEDRLQAIVLADSFTGTFRPCSLDKPKVLLPLLNVPMLDYVMEFLVASGVQEVFIFCVNKREVVQEYMARSKWPSSVALRCISSAKCMGAGDALREMDTLGLVRSNPFIIISGDVVSTVNLPAVIAAHKKRKAENSLAILTVVLSKVGYDAAVHPRQEDLVVGLDKASGQLVVYEDEAEEPATEVELELFGKEAHPEIVLRNDLMDCHIYVCSPEVLVAFSDNWDYQDMPRYIRNEVQNREMGNRLFAHVTGPHEYAARVHDPHVYHAVSKDLMHRWLYPNVPENNNIHSGDRTTFRYHKRWLYKETGDGSEGGVNVSRSATISKTVLLGQGTSIGPGSQLDTSVVGRRVRIGANVTIRDAHIWNDVVIEDGAVIDASILADGVVVGAGAKVGRGSMLSYGVVIGRGVELAPFSRVTATPAASWGGGGGFSMEGYSPKSPGGYMEAGVSEDASDPAVVGPDGVGRKWAPLFDGERIPEAELRAQSIGATEEDEARRQRWGTLEEEEEDEEEFLMDDDAGYASPSQVGFSYSMGGGGGSSSSYISGSSTAAPSGAAAADGGAEASATGSGSGMAAGSTTTDAYFAHVVRDMVISGFASRHPVANILLEVKSFKFAHNRSFAAVVSAVVPALLDLALDPDVVSRQQREEEQAEAAAAGGGNRRATRGDSTVAVAEREESSGSAAASAASGGAGEAGMVDVPVLPDKVALANVNAQLEYWDAMLRALNQEPEVEAALLAATEEYALRERFPPAQSLYNVFGLVLVAYVRDAEVLHKAAALAWVDRHEAAAADGSLGSRAKALFQESRTQKFVTWIRDYESESEEEESDSDDEESGSDSGSSEGEVDIDEED